jgi:hypothetical protein
MAIRRPRTGTKNIGKNQKDTYYFDIDKCKQCPLKEGCYKEGSKSKTYSIRIKSTEHSEQNVFQESEYFKEKSKERYKIEAKNSELKHRHGYDVASTSGLVGMQMHMKEDLGPFIMGRDEKRRKEMSGRIVHGFPTAEIVDAGPGGNRPASGSSPSRA